MTANNQTTLARALVIPDNGQLNGLGPRTGIEEEDNHYQGSDNAANTLTVEA